MLTGRQIRETRGLLGWTRADLARITFVALPVVEMVEDHGTTFMLLDVQMRAIWTGFEQAGVEFVRDNASGAVRLRKGEN